MSRSKITSSSVDSSISKAIAGLDYTGGGADQHGSLSDHGGKSSKSAT